MVVSASEEQPDHVLTLVREASVGDGETNTGRVKSAVATSQETIHIKVSGPTEIDVTFLQLLLAFQSPLSPKRQLRVGDVPQVHPVRTTGRLLGLELEHHSAVEDAK